MGNTAWKPPEASELLQLAVHIGRDFTAALERSTRVWVPGDYIMKRGLSMLLTVALIGSLMFMGFAGTASAQVVDIGSDVDVDQTANSSAEVNTAQSNSNSQTQVAVSEAESTTSEATTYAEQAQVVEQSNANSVGDVTSVAANNADTDADTGIDVNATVDLGDLDLGGIFG